VHDRQWRALGLGGKRVAEDLAEQPVHDRVEPLLSEAVPVLLRLPHIDVPQATLGSLDGKVGDEPLWCLITHGVGDALVERRVERNVLGERVGHAGGLLALIRILFGWIMGRMGPEVKGRSYDTAGREAQSAETRQRIVEAARDLVLERGYRATTIAAVAARAVVNVDTVYELVGRKPVLLRELIEQAVSGTDHAVVAEERDHIKAILVEPNPAKKLVIYARAVRETQQRMAPLFLALRDASSTEPEAHQVWQQISERRAANMHKLARDLRDSGGLRPGLSISEAADVLWATNSSEMYVLLTVDRCWSPQRFERWLADTWHRLLLG